MLEKYIDDVNLVLEMIAQGYGWSSVGGKEIFKFPLRKISVPNWRVLGLFIANYTIKQKLDFRLETGTVPNLMPSNIVPSLTSQVILNKHISWFSYDKCLFKCFAQGKPDATRRRGSFDYPIGGGDALVRACQVRSGCANVGSRYIV